MYAIGAIAILASVNALAHSYAGLYDWASTHRMNAWQSITWPAEIDVFLVVGELALYVALPGRVVRSPQDLALGDHGDGADRQRGRQRRPHPAAAQPAGDACRRLTAATSPVAAFAGLTIGLLVLKMTRHQTVRAGRSPVTPAGLMLAPRVLVAEPHGCEPDQTDVVGAFRAAGAHRQEAHLLRDTDEILQFARTRGDKMSQRRLTAQLRDRGLRFSNAQLRGIATTIGLAPKHQPAPRCESRGSA